MEYCKIGGSVIKNGIKLKIEKRGKRGSCCKDCYFESKKVCPGGKLCSRYFRKDKEDIIFSKIEKGEEKMYVLNISGKIEGTYISSDVKKLENKGAAEIKRDPKVYKFVIYEYRPSEEMVNLEDLKVVEKVRI